MKTSIHTILRRQENIPAKPVGVSMLTLLGLALLQLVTFWSGAWAQPNSGTIEVFGGPDNEDALAMAVGSNLGSIIGGHVGPTGGAKDGFLIWEVPGGTAQVGLAKRYSLGNGDLSIVAMDTAAPSGTLAVVGNRTGGTGTADAVFMHVSATGSVLGTRFFGTTLAEKLNDVLCLSDGSFVVAGQLGSSDGTKRSFVMRIGSQAQSYAVQWVRTLGAASGFATSADEAIALDQFADGRLLVCGFTDQGAATAQGAPYLWQLDLNGNTLALNRHAIDANLLRPVPKDVAITASAGVWICGIAQQESNPTRSKGWLLRLENNLTGPQVRSVTFMGYPSRNLELRSLAGLTAGSEIVAGGIVDYFDGFQASDGRALIVMMNTIMNPTLSATTELAGLDGLSAIQLVVAGGTSFVRGVGVANRPVTSPSNMGGSNALVQVSGSASGFTCQGTTTMGILVAPHKVGTAAITLTTGTSLTTSTVLMAVSTYSPQGVRTCD